MGGTGAVGKGGMEKILSISSITLVLVAPEHRASK
jgi:hypothetical protein